MFYLVMMNGVDYNLQPFASPDW